MPLVGVVIENTPVPWDQVPHAVLQPEIIQAMKNVDRGGVHLSDLIGCPYQCVRQKRYDYYLKPQNVYWMARGKAWDALVEKYPVEGRETQAKMRRQLDGVWVYGTPDVLDWTIRRVEDNKSPVKLNGYQEIPLTYALQVNGYRWLIDQPDFDLRLNCTAHFQYEQIEVPVFPLEDVEDELSMRLHILMEVAAMPDVVPQCDNKKCYCYSDGFIDTNHAHKWGLEEMYEQHA